MTNAGAAPQSAFAKPRPRQIVVRHSVGVETGSASQDYIQLYDGDAKLLTESLARIQQNVTEILNAIGAEEKLRVVRLKVAG